MRFAVALAAMSCLAVVTAARTLQAAATEPLGVVVTIKPVHSLAAAVLEGAGVPQLLIKGAESAHTYALRPSDARMLSNAELIIRVSGQLETFLEKPLASLSGPGKVITLAGIPEMHLLPVRSGGLFDAGNHEGHNHGSDGAGSQGEHEVDGRGLKEHDPHLWLSPENAAIIADHLASVFAARWPEHKALFAANSAKLKEKLAALQMRLNVQLTPLAERKFFVFHDAYHYFEAAFGVEATGSITFGPDRQPGAARLQQLRGKIAELDRACIFSEPQFEPKLVSMLISGTSAKAGSLDPLGADIPEGPEHYFRLMENLARDLKSCLGSH